MAALIQNPRCFAFHRLLSPLSHWRSLATDALIEAKSGGIGIVSGIPEEHLCRRVIIYSPARTASQQGSGKVGKWKINFISTQKWENPLMGWTSTGDPYANVGDSALYFDSREAAKEFAERHGWEYLVKDRHTPLLKLWLLCVDEEIFLGFRSQLSCGGQIPSQWMTLLSLLQAKSYADNFKWKGLPKSDEI